MHSARCRPRMTKCPSRPAARGKQQAEITTTVGGWALANRRENQMETLKEIVTELISDWAKSPIAEEAIVQVMDKHAWANELSHDRFNDFMHAWFRYHSIEAEDINGLSRLVKNEVSEQVENLDIPAAEKVESDISKLKDDLSATAGYMKDDLESANAAISVLSARVSSQEEALRDLSAQVQNLWLLVNKHPTQIRNVGDAAREMANSARD